MVQPDGMADDLCGEPMTIVRSGRGFIPPVSPAFRSPARTGYRDNAEAAKAEDPTIRSTAEEDLKLLMGHGALSSGVEK